MSTLAIIGAVAMIVISILIIVVVSLQEGKGDGITLSLIHISEPTRPY